MQADTVASVKSAPRVRRTHALCRPADRFGWRWSKASGVAAVGAPSPDDVAAVAALDSGPEAQSALSPAQLAERRKALVAFFRQVRRRADSPCSYVQSLTAGMRSGRTAFIQHHVPPHDTDNEGPIQLLRNVTIAPPYTADDIRCENEMVLRRVADLLAVFDQPSAARPAKSD